jgi:hypothetical protein
MRDWTTELVRFVVADDAHGADNRRQIETWVRDWLPEAAQAAAALAAIAEQLPVGIDTARAAERVRRYAGELLEEAELPELVTLIGAQPKRRPPAAATPARRVDAGPAGVRPAREKRPAAAAAQPAPAGNGDGTYDYVGIVMAKSAEGDAVADILRRRRDIQVLEQAAFWDIRAKNRLVIPYDEVSEQLGYEIDAYSIQHEMSTHYGRMVAGDDALMLFSDPTEAMEHLMA